MKPAPQTAILHQNGQWLHFSRPQQIIQADRLEQVLPALREIEKLVETRGWHAAGFLSYEAAPAFDSALRVRPDTGFPLLWFGLYPEPAIAPLPNPADAADTAPWQPTVDRETYNAAIAAIKEAIARGQTYQVNYTMRLRNTLTDDPWPLFLRLAQAQQAGYEAYLDTGEWIIASASPELFFQLEGETITGRPMKGTTRRGRTPLEDQAQAEWLRHSIKNRAENVMIVDMIRNDLGRIAQIGSVRVPALFTTERYPTLWQMTSTVTAQTRAGVTEILQNLFPCASITGAPKVSTMNIIARLETTPRRIYTGSIGYLAPGRVAQFNVAIRTVLLEKATGRAEYGVGGGIVWDSTSADEYEEALLKSKILTSRPRQFSLIETLLWDPPEGWFLPEKHLERMLASADYFGFPLEKKTLTAFLNELAFDTPQRVRILLGSDGRLEYQASPFRAPAAPLKFALAARPVNSQDVFLFHKTTRRDMYDSARETFPEADDVLLYNEHGELTEFTLGNVVVELPGGLFTPPVTCGLLAGTFRAHLLESGQIQERIIRLEELTPQTRLYFINSVRKWQETYRVK